MYSGNPKLYPSLCVMSHVMLCKVTKRPRIMTYISTQHYIPHVKQNNKHQNNNFTSRTKKETMLM